MGVLMFDHNSQAGSNILLVLLINFRKEGADGWLQVRAGSMTLAPFMLL